MLVTESSSISPDTAQARTPHLAVNEHFCMSLARQMGLPAAEISLLRTPRPVLVVRRFDREVQGTGEQIRVQRLHIIDTCQACDLPVSYKYERNLGNAAEVRHIREGLSLEKLFACADLSGNKASTRLAMLRWALFQFLIGNSDAHGKNFSFFVRPGGLLEPSPWYDLVSVLQYQGFDTELAMAYGDIFEHEAVSAFALADFATRCGIDRKLLEVGRVFRLSPVAMVRRVMLPAVLPEWLIALRSGLGYLIMDSRNAGNRYDLVIASMIIIGIIGLLLDSSTRAPALA